MKRILSLISILIATLLLNGCIILGDPNPLDETKGWSAERIFNEAQRKMAEKDYDLATRYFETLESRYPHGVYARQAQLELAYAYYKRDDVALSLASAQRFIKLHPNHPNVDYAYYLKGLATFNERGWFRKLSRQQISDRDPKTLKLSFAAFKELTERFPKSRYYADSIQRMVYLVNQLAEHEMHVARYYMNRKAYVAALNRAKYVTEYYPNSTSVEQALVTMVSAYDHMEMDDLKQDTIRVLQTNYPDNAMITGKLEKAERSWWKFWESL